MANVADNVRVGVTGAVFFAPTGTTLPTTLAGALDAGFLDVGYISEDGITTSVSMDTNEIRAWQNGDVVRRVQTAHDYTLAFTMLETNERSLEVFYGNYDDTTDAVEVTGTQGYRGEWVINVDDGTDDLRIVIPDGQVTEKGDVQYVNGDAVMYPLTITAYPDSSGVKAYIYFTDPTA